MNGVQEFAPKSPYFCSLPACSASHSASTEKRRSPPTVKRTIPRPLISQEISKNPNGVGCFTGVEGNRMRKWTKSAIDQERGKGRTTCEAEGSFSGPNLSFLLSRFCAWGVTLLQLRPFVYPVTLHFSVGSHLRSSSPKTSQASPTRGCCVHLFHFPSCFRCLLCASRH